MRAVCMKRVTSTAVLIPRAILSCQTSPNSAWLEISSHWQARSNQTHPKKKQQHTSIGRVHLYYHLLRVEEVPDRIDLAAARRHRAIADRVWERSDLAPLVRHEVVAFASFCSDLWKAKRRQSHQVKSTEQIALEWSAFRSGQKVLGISKDVRLLLINGTHPMAPVAWQRFRKCQPTKETGCLLKHVNYSGQSSR